MLIVGVRGDKGSGKSTLAEALQEHYGYRVVAFADPLKWAAGTLFGLTPDQLHDPRLKEVVVERWGVTPRNLLQRLGTEVGRDGKMQEFEELGVGAAATAAALSSVGVTPGDGCWIRAWVERASNYPRVVAPDVRFPDEGEAVRGLGGVIILVERPGTGGDTHASKVSQRSIKPDLTINNAGSLSSFPLYAAAVNRLAIARMQ